MDGKGKSEIGGQTFDWESNDILVVPNFIWRRHINTGTTDAVLYTVTDAALKNIGQYRAQGKDKDGKVVQLVRRPARRKHTSHATEGRSARPVTCFFGWLPLFPMNRGQRVPSKVGLWPDQMLILQIGDQRLQSWAGSVRRHRARDRH